MYHFSLTCIWSLVDHIIISSSRTLNCLKHVSHTFRRSKYDTDNVTFCCGNRQNVLLDVSCICYNRLRLNCCWRDGKWTKRAFIHNFMVKVLLSNLSTTLWPKFRLRWPTVDLNSIFKSAFKSVTQLKTTMYSRSLSPFSKIVHPNYPLTLILPSLYLSLFYLKFKYFNDISHTNTIRVEITAANYAFKIWHFYLSFVQLFFG